MPKASEIFKDNKDRDNFLAKLGDILVETLTLCFAWALIPNHFHLIDAIVNPANEKLELGTGVAGAIREKGGPSIQKECDRIGGTAVGTAVITGAGDLPIKHVLHAVGPRMGEGDEDRKLASAVRASLALADRHGLKSIAIPAISTGNFGFPVNRCARVTLTEIHRYLQGGTKL